MHRGEEARNLHMLPMHCKSCLHYAAIIFYANCLSACNSVLYIFMPPRGTWHLSADGLLTVNLCVNAEHMQRGHGDYAPADEILFFGADLKRNESLRNILISYCG